MLVFAVFGAAGSKDLLCNRIETWLYVDVLLAVVAFIVWAWPSPWLVAAGVVGLGVWATGRGPVVGWSMGRSLAHLTGRRGFDARRHEPRTAACHFGDRVTSRPSRVFRQRLRLLL